MLKNLEYEKVTNLLFGKPWLVVKDNFDIAT